MTTATDPETIFPLRVSAVGMALAMVAERPPVQYRRARQMLTEAVTAMVAAGVPQDDARVWAGRIAMLSDRILAEIAEGGGHTAGEC